MDKINKSVAILDLLAAAGDVGMRFSEIQRALWSMNNPGEMPKKFRGYWCTNLLGGCFYHGGLLRTFATKGPDGRWRRNTVEHLGKPWTVVNKPRFWC